MKQTKNQTRMGICISGGKLRIYRGGEGLESFNTGKIGM